MHATHHFLSLHFCTQPYQQSLQYISFLCHQKACYRFLQKKRRRLNDRYFVSDFQLVCYLHLINPCLTFLIITIIIQSFSLFIFIILHLPKVSTFFFYFPVPTLPSLSTVIRSLYFGRFIAFL